MQRQFEVILNPIAGAGRAVLLVDRLARRLEREGHGVRVLRTESAGHAREYARQLAGESGIDALLVAGGDGTISEVVDGLAGSVAGGSRLPMAILPVGTENLLARVIGARTNLALAEATLLGGRERRLDVGQIRRPPDAGGAWDSGSGPSKGLRHFMMVAGAGFDAEVVHRLAMKRDGNITYADYFAPIMQTLARYDFPAMRIEADGETVCDEPALAFVGNIPRYAWGLPICKKARYDDGLLDLVIYKCAHRGQLVLHSVRTVFSAHIGRRDVIYRQVRHIVLRCERAMPIQVDGDDGGQLPVELTMAGEQVRLLAPPLKERT
ncbi:MAG: Diacylglycerol kinase [Phycisphaerae bacterium]|nr:Diacylglycerol kinase [Phycisphaerae bacterium]